MMTFQMNKDTAEKGLESHILQGVSWVIQTKLFDICAVSIDFLRICKFLKLEAHKSCKMLEALVNCIATSLQCSLV